MTLVVDASVVVAGLVDDSEVGHWAEEMIGTSGLAAPALMPFEAANILRRVSLHGDISADVAALAHGPNRSSTGFAPPPKAVTSRSAR